MTTERHESLRMTFSSLMFHLYNEPYLSDEEWNDMMANPETRKDIEAAVAAGL